MQVSVLYLFTTASPMEDWDAFACTWSCARRKHTYDPASRGLFMAVSNQIKIHDIESLNLYNVRTVLDVSQSLAEA